MENRIQHLFLITKAALASTILLASSVLADDGQGSRSSGINSEVFDLGVFAGVINIADFNGEFVAGVSATFRASEDFFLQYNFLQAESSPSAYENNQGLLFDGGDRTFRHYDLLVGYNLFQGEFFSSGSPAKLSTLYLVGGVGDTQFGGEDSFTYTVGVGYQVALTRSILLRFDYRSYIYTSSLVTDENKTVSSQQLSGGLSYLF